jgi:hypothetical protein
MKIGDHPIDLMIHMGAERLVVTQPMGPLSQKHATIIGNLDSATLGAMR